MSLIQVLHYYCKPRRADILNNITYQQGISCQIQTSYLDIPDIVRELTNKNHVDCIAIDEDLFGAFNKAEDIVSQIDVLKYVCENTEILIIALDREKTDEIITALHKSGLADCIITKEMSNEYEDILKKYFDGNLKRAQDGDPKSNNDFAAPELSNTECVNTSEEVVQEYISEDTEQNQTNVIFEGADDEPDIETDDNEQEPHTAHKEKIKNGPVMNISSIFSKFPQREKNDMPEEEIIESDNITVPDDKTITIGICGLQPHIGVTHHALAMAQAMSGLYKHVCYQECNTHDAYRVLQTSSIAAAKQGYIRIMNVDIFDRNADISVLDKYNIRIMDFGYINECRQEDLFNTDIPIVICGVKDWEIQNFIGAYNSGVLEKVIVLINFFPKKEQSAFASTFHDLQIFFADYAPEVFEPESNMEMYTDIIKNI